MLVRTLEQCHFKGYPQKSFTPDSNVLKVDFLKKGGGGTTRILLQMRVVGFLDSEKRRLGIVTF